MLDREPYRPTPAETITACETLLRSDISREARQVVLSKYAEACRDCARGLLRTARSYKAQGNHSEVARLVKKSRFYWRWYIWEIAQ